MTYRIMFSQSTVSNGNKDDTATVSAGGYFGFDFNTETGVLTK